MRGWISQPIEEPNSLSTNVLLDQEISIKTQSRKTHISYILIRKPLETHQKASKINENEWKRNQKASKINENPWKRDPEPGNRSLSMRNLCASYARNHTTPLGLADQLASAALRRQKISICGASLAPSVFGLVVKTANTHNHLPFTELQRGVNPNSLRGASTHKTNEIQ